MSARLVLTFSANNGGDVVFSYPYADDEVEASDVQTLMQTMITNGSIFSVPPVTAKSAKLITTTETDISLS